MLEEGRPLNTLFAPMWGDFETVSFDATSHLSLSSSRTGGQLGHMTAPSFECYYSTSGRIWPNETEEDHLGNDSCNAIKGLMI